MCSSRNLSKQSAQGSALAVGAALLLEALSDGAGDVRVCVP
eukprot:COSAG06_NODE_41735_length_388_cov_0.892734_1_plen_40_part_10